jgi:hypothetical protein
MTTTRSCRAFALSLALLASGCMGTIRDTTTARGSTEMLLLSSAVEGAIRRWDVSALAGKRVFIDTQFLETVDEPYLVSSMRYRAARGGAILVDLPEAELVVEVRCGAFACWDGSFMVGVPPLPVGQFGISVISPNYMIGNTNRQAWAKLQLFVYEPHSRQVVATSGDLWGASREDLLGSVYPSLLDTAGATLESEPTPYATIDPPAAGSTR